MWTIEDKFSVKIGGNKYINVPNILVYKGESVFKITRADSTGQLGIDFEIYDKTGIKIAVVRNGRIYSGNKDNYEIVVEADRYSLTDKKAGQLLCEIKKRQSVSASELEVNVALYMCDGFLFEATPDQTNVGGFQITGSIMRDSQNGIVIN